MPHLRFPETDFVTYQSQHLLDYCVFGLCLMKHLRLPTIIWHLIVVDCIQYPGKQNVNSFPIKFKMIPLGIIHQSLILEIIIASMIVNFII